MVRLGKTVGSRRVYRICMQLALGSLLWGYNIGILASVLAHPGWRSALHEPTPWQKGLVTGFYYLGTLLSYLFVAHSLADRLGRRAAACAGTLFLCAGTLLIASAAGPHSLQLMMAGRWICGVGAGVLSTTVPLYQSEISPAKQRGKFVTINHVGFVVGTASGLWAGFLITFWQTQAGQYWGWRVLVLIQLVPALSFLAMLPCMPETPRWLLQKGYTDQASKVLYWLSKDVQDTAATCDQFRAISNDIQINQSTQHSSAVSRYSDLLREKPLFARTWRAFLLHFMAQLCGATAMKYYLPTLLKTLGLGTRFALMVDALEMTAKIGILGVEMRIIDSLGRKACLAGGCVIMAVAMLVNGALPALFPNNVSKPADTICIAFIFVYAIGYSLGLGPTIWLYSSEIFPTPYRARGLNLAASGGSIGSIIVTQVWPVGVARFSSDVYFFFMMVNVICVPVIWMFYPETKGCALQDMNSLFNKLLKQSTATAAVLPDRITNQEGNANGNEDRNVSEASPLLP